VAEPGTYTARNRRIPTPDRPIGKTTRFPAAFIKAAPAPPPEVPPRPFGDLSRASAESIWSLIDEVLDYKSQSGRLAVRQSLFTMLGHLDRFSGATWQERWEASGLNASDGVPVRTLPCSRGRGKQGSELTSAAKLLFCLRVIQPSLPAFRANKFTDYPAMFQRFQNDPLLEAFYDRLDSRPEPSYVYRRRAKFDVACALTTQGITLVDLTPAALLHYAVECRRRGLTPIVGSDSTQFAGRTAWLVLHEMGQFPAGTAPTMRTYLYSGQKTVEEMVDLHQVRHPGVRQLLIDYLTRRRVETDYKSCEGLARHLAANFWSTIERLNPTQDDLRLSGDLYDQWRAELSHYRSGGELRERKDLQGVLLAVRGFYVDLHSWAIEEPELWAAWVAPCPIRPQDLKGFAKRRRAINQRMADRTRVRQPLLPALLAHTEARYSRYRALLEIAERVPLGEEFTHDSQRYQRTNSRAEQRREVRGEDPRVRIQSPTGPIVDLTKAEDAAFWEWAVIQTLRHTGIRIEELCELTHLSIRQYQRPNGEVIALLVIAPSKTDRERVIPMSAEVFHVLAEVVRRHIRTNRAVPLITRYDPHERTWSAPLPFLFQRKAGASRAVINPGTILRMLQSSCEELGRHTPQFAGVTFTPHDFRRLFATEVVNGGLPIHIGAALLGHMNLQTTQGYVAVFSEDVVAHYQQFLSHRRSLRPEGEYVEVAAQEWGEFEEHFDKRKVELGACARPYGTPCQHEHACVRCPMLHVDPKMLGRLDEIETDLLNRRARAEAEGWLGELEGIDLTLAFLRSKQDEVRKVRKTGPVNLGVPDVPRPRTTGS
jgi:integrase